MLQLQAEEYEHFYILYEIDSFGKQIDNGYQFVFMLSPQWVALIPLQPHQ